MVKRFLHVSGRFSVDSIGVGIEPTVSKPFLGARNPFALVTVRADRSEPMSGTQVIDSVAGERLAPLAEQPDVACSSRTRFHLRELPRKKVQGEFLLQDAVGKRTLKACRT